MSDGHSNLAGSVVEVYRRCEQWSEGVAKQTSVVINRGQVRSVTAAPSGDLVVWIEELDEAETACWFGDPAPSVEWENGGIERPGQDDSTPGKLRCATLTSGENDLVELVVLRRPKTPSIAWLAAPRGA